MHSREGLSTAHVKHILRSVLRNTLQLHTLCGVSLPNYRSPGSASFMTTSCLQTTGTAWCLGLNRFSTGGAGSRSKCSGSMQLPARGDLTLVMLGWEEHGRSQRLSEENGGSSSGAGQRSLERELIDYQHDHRLRPPAGIIARLGSRFLSHTTRSQRKEMEVREHPHLREKGSLVPEGLW